MRRTPLTEVAPAISSPTGAFGNVEPRTRSETTRRKSTGPRAGKKAVPFWIPEAAKRQLDLLGLEQDTTTQALMTDALNDLFRKFGKPPIA
jgi:hypothetical protein